MIIIICIIIFVCRFCVRFQNIQHSTFDNQLAHSHTFFTPKIAFATLTSSVYWPVFVCRMRTVLGDGGGGGDAAACGDLCIFLSLRVAQMRNSVERGKHHFHVVHTSKQLNPFIQKCLSKNENKFPNS